MTAETTLLPCPFCGSAFIEAAGGQVMCNGCDSGTAVEDDLDTAIAAWNCRASQAAPASHEACTKCAGSGMVLGDCGDPRVCPECKGDAVAPAPDGALREQVAFLLERLASVNGYTLNNEDARDWYGHVEPAISRTRDALNAAPTQGGAA